MKISVIGTGYVGLVTGVCFAEMGNKVTCIDIDENKVQKMKDGICPIYEPGLEALMKNSIEDKRVFFDTSYDSIKEATAVFMAVGTPSRDDGSADLKYLYKALDDLVPFISDGLIVVLKSTVPVGTGEAVKAYLKNKTDKRFIIVNNPEFLKEGSAVADFMKPERVIIGTDCDESFKVMEKLYKPFMRQQSRIIQMSNLSAEMTKYAANCFLATKISFMNEIAKLCDRTGADVTEVRAGISTDSRIGAQFLYPGPGYGGSCFPKDVKALVYTAKQNDMNLQIVQATEDVNAQQKLYMFEKAKTHFGDLKGKTITLWGVAFKANTDDIRETPAIYITKALNEAGANVKFYDPIAANNFEAFCSDEGMSATKVENKYDALNKSDALMILTEWKQFRAPDFSEIKSRLNNALIFDGRNLYDTENVKNEGFKYYAVGKRIS
ncbi:MAG: UDP-glucose/GDP-mannose dehydrogenase family protein [Bacteriovoracaceae bacterium]|jgi:UDPglucose 6-dehydrogenase|nr:UDP-glucose/GDP-mannose dehydrogenase family protein [Bacteriovoracaceae bacterium]